MNRLCVSDDACYKARGILQVKLENMMIIVVTKLVFTKQ